MRRTATTSGLLLAFALGTVACSSDGGRQLNRGSGSEGSGGSGGTGTKDGGDANGTVGETLGLAQVRGRCESSKTGPRLLRRLTRGELQATIEDAFPELSGSWQGVKLSPDQASRLGLTNDAAVLTVAFQTAKQLLETAEDVAALVASDGVLESVLPCAGAGDGACADEFIGQYGSRLFRRPFTEEEAARYRGLFDSSAT